MSEPFIAEIRMWGCTFAPRGWADCDGQLMSIASNTALFSLLGTVYGGDGRSTFGLPSLQSRAAMHAGHGPGLSNQPLGAYAGAGDVTLTENQLPAHNHDINVNTDNASAALGADKVLAKGLETEGFPANRPNPEYAAAGSGTAVSMAGNVLSPTGGSSPHTNMQPYLAVRFSMALLGVYPSRN